MAILIILNNIDYIELPKELVILNSIKDEDVEILKKYNLDKGKIEKNYTLDRFLLLKNSKEKIDILANNNKLEYKDERLSDESDFGSSDYSSCSEEEDEKDAVDNENFNIFSTRKFIGGNI